MDSRWKTLLWVLAGGGTFGLVYLIFFRRPDEASPEELEMAPPSDRTEVPTFPHVSIGPNLYLRADAGQAFIAMKEAAKRDGVDIPVSTAYRSLAWQQRLWNAWIAYKEGRGPWAPLAAKPDGNGPHQRGRAVDLHGLNPSKPNYNAKRDVWLKANAAKFGWYQTGLGFSMKEPWHWYYKGSAFYPALVA